MAVNRDIQYLDRDFSEIRTKLIEFSQTYFPNTYNDFSPASPGMMFMEQAAYVGDVMSFYLDNQLQETFTQFANQTNNLYELAYMFGYKPKATSAAIVTIDLYQQVPAKNVGAQILPNFDYALSVGDNTKVTTISNNNVSFLIQDKCDFSISSSSDPTEISVYQVSGDEPQYYLLKKSRKAISAEINSTNFTFTTPEPFQTIEIEGNNIIKILDITDSDGNIWNEVDYLAQEMVYNSIKNTNPNDPNNVADVGEVPYLLQLKKVQRRFATRFISNNVLQIQFGAGNPNDTDEEITPNPNNVGIGLPFKQDKLTTAYSPTNFLFTNTYGIAPSSTTLTVRYLTGGGVGSNVAASTITEIDSINTTFQSNDLNAITSQYIFETLAIDNPQAADGGKAGDTDEIIRQNTIGSISAQQRTVTLDDYMVRALSMPADYGKICKIYMEKPTLDNQTTSAKTLSMYLLSQDINSKYIPPSSTLMNNLRTYLSQYKMICDSIELKSAFYINFLINFEIVVLPNFINSQVILSCIESIKSYFDRDKWQINQPIMVNSLYVRLDQIQGVQTVKNIKFTNRAGTASGYSEYAYDIEGATLNDVIYSSLDPSIFELRYPNQDVQGRVVPL